MTTRLLHSPNTRQCTQADSLTRPTNRHPQGHTRNRIKHQPPVLPEKSPSTTRNTINTVNSLASKPKSAQILLHNPLCRPRRPLPPRPQPHRRQPRHESRSLPPHRRVLLAVPLDPRLTRAPLVGGDAIHHGGHMVPAPPPGGLFYKKKKRVCQHDWKQNAVSGDTYCMYRR